MAEMTKERQRMAELYELLLKMYQVRNYMKEIGVNEAPYKSILKAIEDAQMEYLEQLTMEYQYTHITE